MLHYAEESLNFYRTLWRRNLCTWCATANNSNKSFICKKWWALKSVIFCHIIIYIPFILSVAQLSSRKYSISTIFLFHSAKNGKSALFSLENYIIIDEKDKNMFFLAIHWTWSILTVFKTYENLCNIKSFKQTLEINKLWCLVFFDNLH